jgi:hypothetical protein
VRRSYCRTPRAIASANHRDIAAQALILHLLLEQHFAFIAVSGCAQRSRYRTFASEIRLLNDLRLPVNEKLVILTHVEA